MSYVHGYEASEAERLHDQAATLAELLHADTAYPKGHKVLEAGCGVGAQTVALARNSPYAEITAIDVSQSSLVQARRAVDAAGVTNVCVRQADIFDLPFDPGSFDDVFVCFVLEHVNCPVQALQCLKSVLRDGGSITVIEGDHGSTYFHPDSPFARRAVRCLIELQARAGGNGEIGRSLFPLLRDAGFDEVRVSPRMVYVDASRSDLVEPFIEKTFTAMVEGVREQAIASGLTSAADFDRGLRDLYRTTKPDGVFCYTFFKGVALKSTTGQDR